jgi:hypothetical protein
VICPDSIQPPIGGILKMAKAPKKKFKTPAWARAAGKNPAGGLNAKGRASAKKQGMNLKPPQPEGGDRRDSFCARSEGQMRMWPKAAKDPNSRLRKARKAWAC